MKVKKVSFNFGQRFNAPKVMKKEPVNLTLPLEILYEIDNDNTLVFEKGIDDADQTI